MLMNNKSFPFLTIFFSILVIALIVCLSIYINSRTHQQILSYASAQEFSNNAYTIYYAKDGRGPLGDGSQFEIYSIQSNGMNLSPIKIEDSQSWEKEAFSHGIHESMNSFYGDFENQDHTKKIIIKSGWFVFSSTPKLFLEERGQRQTKSLLQLGVSELEWLPDGKRIVLSTGDKIGIIDTESNKFGYLTDGAGWIVVKETD